MAALTAVVLGGLAAPAHAAAPAAPVTAAGVLNDLTGDGKADVLTNSGNNLTVLPAGGAPYRAATSADNPEDRIWSEYQVTHRGSATGTGTDDLYAFSRYGHVLYLYPNDANSGGRPGYFTKKDKAVKVAKPATCAAGTDCTGYDPTWNSASQVVATDGIANQDGMPDLVTVEGNRLWYYPGKAGGAVIGAPVQLGTGDWNSVTLMAPGKVGGVPTLWARSPELDPATEAYRLEFGPDGLPVKLLPSPRSFFALQTAERDAAGAKQCLANGQLKSCASGVTRWRLATDGTLRELGRCLALRDGRAGAEDCTGEPAQQWKPRPDGGLAASDGSCLTALAAQAAAGTAPCDGSSRQVWGALTADPAAGPAPLPAPFTFLTVPRIADPGADYYNELTSVSSPGDLDGDGYPELLTSALTKFTSTQSELTFVRRGTAPVGGLHRLGAAESLGDLRTPRNTATAGGGAWPGDVLYSACASLKVEPGGSLVLTDLANGRVLWSSNTPGHAGGRMAVRSDGVLTLRSPDGQVYWSPQGVSVGGSGNVLTVQDDCNVVLRNGEGTALWSTRTYDPAHETAGAVFLAGRSLKAGEQFTVDRTALAMGADGNLVLTDRQSAKVLWTSGTEGHPGAVATLQVDGNLVIRDAAGAPLWSSETWGAASPRLLLEWNGNLTMYDADGRRLWLTNTRFDGVDTRGTVIPSGRTVRSGETVESKAGRLVMQADGNLVLYSKATGNARWSSKTWGNAGATVTMQSDGNLLVKAADGRPLWASGTWTRRNARAVLQDDLNLVVYGTDDLVYWESGTSNQAGVRLGTALTSGWVLRAGESVTHAVMGPPNPVVLTMQDDGNLVLRVGGGTAPVWSARTWGNPGGRAVLQPDGNLVIQAADGHAVWSTATWGHPGAALVLQNDGNVVLYDADGVPLWATGTYR
ncbi:hypothetical protein ACWCYY_39645 [Kitasatospora sp. NPDC001664]